jgi:hypothetical protein
VPRFYFVLVFLCRAFYFAGARSLENLVEGYNWFLNQFVEIPRRSIIVCFLSLSAKAGFKPLTFDRSAVHDHRLGLSLCLAFLPFFSLPRFSLPRFFAAFFFAAFFFAAFFLCRVFSLPRFLFAAFFICRLTLAQMYFVKDDL